MGDIPYLRMGKSIYKNYLRVLSIDFDYFQSVDCDTLHLCYPDGIDLNTKLSTFVWASYYANPATEQKLYDVSVNKEELYAMQEILCRQNKNVPVLITQSHRNIYDFVVNTMLQNGKTDEDGLCVSNVDMHHDFWNDNEKLDCGNWVSHLKKIYPSMGIEWIANPVSKAMYGFEERDGADIISTRLADMRQNEFDAIFLCRSDNWLPPHLDVYFLELCETITEHFDNVKYEQGIFNMREYEEIASEERKLFERQKKRISKGKGERGE